MRLRAPILLLCCASPALAQHAGTPEALVARLADPVRWPAARERLVAHGGAAVPAVTAQLAAADATTALELLAVLRELAPFAGAALADVEALLQRDVVAPTPVVATLAELAPWRDPEDDRRAGEIVLPALRRWITTGELGHVHTTVLCHRLERRWAFAANVELDVLVRFLDARNPLRVEFACEELRRRGAAAAAALPALRTILRLPDPRVLATDQRVPLREKAARAVLAIAPQGADAELARDVLAGRRAPAAAPARPTPERLRDRIDQLVAELALPARRQEAIVNLAALGAPAAQPVARLLLSARDPATLAAAGDVFERLGPLGAPAVATLYESLPRLTVEQACVALWALVAAAPWSTDVVSRPSYAVGDAQVEILGSALPPCADAGAVADFRHACDALCLRLLVDPDAGVAELPELLAHPSLRVREHALEVVATHGARARAMLPQLDDLLAAHAPKALPVLDGEEAARSATVRRAAARAVLAVAAAADPANERARAVLAEPRPK